MTPSGFAVFALVGFLLPVPILAWLDRPRKGGTRNMYAGHFASALAIKARYPKTPTWIPLLGVGLLDILFGPFVLMGWERVTMTPGVSPGFRLDYIDWSHSLL